MPVKVGGVRSSVHVAVLDIVAVLPHASLAVKVLVCERLQPLLTTEPSLCVNDGILHASVAVAPSSAVVILPALGLHPSGTSL